MSLVTFTAPAVPCVYLDTSSPSVAISSLTVAWGRWCVSYLKWDPACFPGFWFMSEETFDFLTKNEHPTIDIDKVYAHEVIATGLLGYLWGWEIRRLDIAYGHVLFALDLP